MKRYKKAFYLYTIIIILSTNIPMIFILYLFRKDTEFLIRLLIFVVMVNIGVFSQIILPALNIKLRSKHTSEFYNGLAILVAVIGLLVLITMKITSFEIYGSAKGIVVALSGFLILIARWQARKSKNLNT